MIRNKLGLGKLFVNPAITDGNTKIQDERYKSDMNYSACERYNLVESFSDFLRDHLSTLHFHKKTKKHVLEFSSPGNTKAIIP